MKNVTSLGIATVALLTVLDVIPKENFNFGFAIGWFFMDSLVRVVWK